MCNLTRIISIALAVILCACSNGENSGSSNDNKAKAAGGLSGTYGDKPISYEFTPERVYITAMGATSATNYEIDGNRILVGVEGGQQVLKILDDGSLEAAMGIVLHKQRASIKPADKGTYPDKPNLSSPGDVAEAYLLAMATYDFYAAFDNTTIRDRVREQPKEEFEQAASEMKAGIEAEGGVAEFRVFDQQINGNTAMVKVETKMGNGKAETESLKFIQLDGRWLID